MHQHHDNLKETWRDVIVPLIESLFITAVLVSMWNPHWVH